MSDLSLAQRYAALQAEREHSWTAEQLAGNARQRAYVVGRYDPVRHAAPGSAVAPFTVIDEGGALLTSDALLARGPAVILFYRFGSCPADNVALPYYDQRLRPALEVAEVPIIAVSPQTPVDLAPVETHGLSIPLYSDPHYTLERALGITFLPEEQPVVRQGESWIGATLGTGSYELPQPTVLILDPDHRIRYIAVSPDWMVRPEAEAILASLTGVPAADSA